MTDVPMRREETWTGLHRGKCHGTMETEIEVPRAKDCHQKLEEARKDSLLQVSELAQPS